jgi:hypothetical protein
MTDVHRGSIPGTDGKCIDRPSVDAQETIGLEQRCEALARLVDLFNNNEWCGANLRDIVAIELAVFADRANVDGPQVLIPPPVAQSMALLVRQLATNALNCGALSSEQGRIRVAWHIYSNSQKEWLHFTWSELPVAPSPNKSSQHASVEGSVRDNPSFHPQSNRSHDAVVCELDIEHCAHSDHSS